MSKENTIVKVEDKTTIACVKFKFSDLMNEEAEQRVVAVHKEFLEAQNALYDARDKVRECEVKFEKAKAKWLEVQKIADIEFATVEKEISTPHETSMFFNGLGNDSIGYHNH